MFLSLLDGWFFPLLSLSSLVFWPECPVVLLTSESSDPVLHLLLGFGNLHDLWGFECSCYLWGSGYWYGSWGFRYLGFLVQARPLVKQDSFDRFVGQNRVMLGTGEQSLGIISWWLTVSYLRFLLPVWPLVKQESSDRVVGWDILWKYLITISIFLLWIPGKGCDHDRQIFFIIECFPLS